MSVTHTALREHVFKLVEQYKLVWHGLYQGRTNAGGHTIPANYDPDIYGAADWNVRLVDIQTSPHTYGYGGGTSVALAVARAIAEIELKRKKAKEVKETVVLDRKLLRSLGVQI